MQICHAYIWNVGPGAGRPRHGVLSEFVCTGNKCTSETQQQQTEFYLSLYAQEINAHLRHNSNRQPYIQTESKRVGQFALPVVIHLGTSA